MIKASFWRMQSFIGEWPDITDVFASTKNILKRWKDISLTGVPNLIC